MALLSLDPSHTLFDGDRVGIATGLLEHGTPYPKCIFGTIYFCELRRFVLLDEPYYGHRLISLGSLIGVFEEVKIIEHLKS